MRKLDLLVVFLVIVVAGCASTSPTAMHLKYLTFEQVRADPAAFDGKQVNIRGYIQADVLGSTSLYANADDAAHDRMYDAIDILSKNRQLREKIKYKSATCVIVSGGFRTYKSGEFKFDMPSKIGVIDLVSVIPC